MKIEQQIRLAHGTRFSVSADGREVGRAYLYLMSNDLHAEPFGLLEDVFVDESARGDGIGADAAGRGYQTMINEALREHLGRSPERVDANTIRRIVREELRKTG